MIVGELRILTVGEGSSLEEPVSRAVGVLEERNVKHQVGPLGTTIETESVEDFFDVVRACHDAVRKDAPRVVTSVTLDERSDKRETTETLATVGS